MNLSRSAKALLLHLVLIAAPATAGFKLMPEGTRTFIGTSTLSVVPSQAWNRLGKRVGRNAESWTLDGVSLNDLTFYAGILPDQTLFKEVNKKEAPLPRFSATMLVPDIVQLFEGSYRIANNTSLFEIGSIEPANFAGHDGFRFTYSFTVKDEEVKRKGEGTGAVIDGKLYMISYEAPVLQYYDRSIGAYRTLAASARVGSANK